MGKVAVHTGGGGGGGELPYVVGTYRGNGGSGQYIEIGFVATAILVELAYGARPPAVFDNTFGAGGIVLRDNPLMHFGSIQAEIYRDGFTARNEGNRNQETYRYIAFR